MNETIENKKNEAEKTDNKKKVIVILLILLLLIGGILAAVLLDKPEQGMVNNRPTYDLTPGSEVKQGEREGTDIEALQEELNRKVEAGMMNISMATNPVFETGTSAGELLIYNSPVNNYPQVVEIYVDETGELIYTSSGIPVGSRIDTDTLDVDLPAGDYACTAYFNAVDPETSQMVGRAGANIVITVLG